MSVLARVAELFAAWKPQPPPVAANHTTARQLAETQHAHRRSMRRADELLAVVDSYRASDDAMGARGRR